PATGTSNSPYASFTLYPPCTGEVHWLLSGHKPWSFASRPLPTTVLRYSVLLDMPRARCTVPAGKSKRPPVMSACSMRSMLWVSHTPVAVVPPPCTTFSDAGLFRLNVSHGVQPGMTVLRSLGVETHTYCPVAGSSMDGPRPGLSADNMGSPSAWVIVLTCP